MDDVDVAVDVPNVHTKGDCPPVVVNCTVCPGLTVTLAGEMASVDVALTPTRADQDAR